jgi:hypothetical protein
VLRHFDTPLDTANVARLTVTSVPVAPEVRITESVTVTAQPSSARAYLAKGEANWSWQDLRDYVVAQIEQRFGVFPRDPRKESGIFKSFLSRYPEHAAAIARYAFEVSDGFWGGAPISVNRFCKGSDRYFADVIAERLVTTEIKGW